jgi:hypothetical protein
LSEADYYEGNEPGVAAVADVVITAADELLFLREALAGTWAYHARHTGVSTACVRSPGLEEASEPALAADNELLERLFRPFCEHVAALGMAMPERALALLTHRPFF